jgi:hypothetical protein
MTDANLTTTKNNSTSWSCSWITTVRDAKATNFNLQPKLDGPWQIVLTSVVELHLDQSVGCRISFTLNLCTIYFGKLYKSCSWNLVDQLNGRPTTWSGGCVCSWDIGKCVNPNLWALTEYGGVEKNHFLVPPLKKKRFKGGLVTWFTWKSSFHWTKVYSCCWKAPVNHIYSVKLRGSTVNWLCFSFPHHFTVGV